MALVFLVLAMLLTKISIQGIGILQGFLTAKIAPEVVQFFLCDFLAILKFLLKAAEPQKALHSSVRKMTEIPLHSINLYHQYTGSDLPDHFHTLHMAQ